MLSADTQITQMNDIMLISSTTICVICDRLCSIEPFVRRIERRHRNVEHAQPADRPMAAAGLDEDRVAGPHGVPFAVELHLALAFEDVIDFGQPLVVVRPRVGCEISTMCSDATPSGSSTNARRVSPHGHSIAGNSAGIRVQIWKRLAMAYSIAYLRPSLTFAHLPSAIDFSTASSTATHWAPSRKSAMIVGFLLIAPISSYTAWTNVCS